jgi:hypothetical protein
VLNSWSHSVLPANDLGREEGSNLGP